MATKFASERNLKFLLYEVLDVESLTKLEYFQDHNREIFDMVIDTAMRLGRDQLFPVFQELDRQPPQYVDGQVKVHPYVRSFMKEAGEGGWISMSFPYDVGGQQLPIALHMITSFIFGAANFAAGAYPGLTTGASHLILSFGNDELKETYVPKMLAGEWQGTMALTEPQAGSSLSDITTRAEPTDEGYYKIRGQKIFISAGDHDGVDNVVHLMLAKIKGAPLGVKGISLFVVPKKRVEPDGSLSPNDLACAGIYHKLGYKGCPITQLSMGENDDCRGYLVGEPHKGLSYMFQMMNEARLGVGMQAISIASAAYYAALEYAKERPQGRRLGAKDPSQPQIPILEHADIKRMLLFQRAVIEGSLSLLVQCSYYSDMAAHGDAETKERYDLLLDLLTPVGKTYPSEMGVISVSQGIQVLGGYGYCDEFPLEQYYRDMRIHPIHEGTTGIQAMDLLGRKAIMQNGAAMRFYFEEVQKTIQDAGEDAELKPYADRLQLAMDRLQEVTMHLVGFAMKGEIELFLADATLYLEFFGIITISWQWLLQGVAAQKGLKASPTEGDARFYQGKLMTLKYFFHYELPKTQGLAARLMEADGLTIEMNESFFTE